MDIRNRVVVITGASAGIGRAAAQLFAQHGAHLALVARSREALEDLGATLPVAFVAPADMRDPDAVRATIQQVYQHYGRVDVLINNAGQGMHVPIADANIDDYRALLELNVVAVLMGMQAVVPIMRQQPEGGVIVNISSGLSKRIIGGVGPYASTKYALKALSLTARLELAPDNIGVGLVYPGVTATDFMRNARAVAQTQSRRAAPADTPEHAAAKILQAVQTEAAEVYADSIAP